MSKQQLHIYKEKEFNTLKITDGVEFSTDIDFQIKENDFIVNLDDELIEKYFKGELFFVDENNKIISKVDRLIL